MNKQTTLTEEEQTTLNQQQEAIKEGYALGTFIFIEDCKEVKD